MPRSREVERRRRSRGRARRSRARRVRSGCAAGPRTPPRRSGPGRRRRGPPRRWRRRPPCRTSSPAAWPKRSLSSLNRSMSTMSTPTRVLGPSAPRQQRAELVEVAAVRQAGQGVGRGLDLGGPMRAGPRQRGRRLERRAVEQPPGRRGPRLGRAPRDDDGPDDRIPPSAAAPRACGSARTRSGSDPRSGRRRPAQPRSPRRRRPSRTPVGRGGSRVAGSVARTARPGPRRRGGSSRAGRRAGR